MGDFNEKFNAFIKTLYDNNYIFYIIAIALITSWVLYLVINIAFGILGWSSIAEHLYYILNLREELTELIIGIIGTVGLCVLYIAFCNTCYIAEYYSKKS